jgi:ABC-2 type transport system permease protein
MNIIWTLAIKDLRIIGRDRTGLLFILCVPLIFAVFFGAMYGDNPVPQLSAGPTAFELSFPQGIVWGLLSVLMAFSTSLVSERSNGTLVRLQLAPIHKAQILGGKALACFLLNSVVMVLLLALGAQAFGVQPDSWALLFIALICVSVAMTGLMMFLATFGKNERTTQNIGWTLMILMAMAGGGMMPLVFMSDWLATLSEFSPIMWAVTALEGALWRGFDGAEMLRPCAVLLGIGVVAFSAGVARFKMHA